MNFQELVGHVRTNVLRDTALPSLWTDTELKRYLNEAHAEFARRTHCLLDDESAFTNFTTTAGVASYPLDPRIIAVLSAHVRKPLGVEPDAVEDEWLPMRDMTRGQIGRSIMQRRPWSYTAQASRHTIRLAAPADDVYEVQMLVARKPLALLADAAAEPEIDEDYHLALCDYAAWRSLSNNDPERANMEAAASFRATWDLQVRDAKRNQALLHAGAAPLVRGNWTGKIRRVR